MCVRAYAHVRVYMCAVCTCGGGVGGRGSCFLLWSQSSYFSHPRCSVASLLAQLGGFLHTSTSPAWLRYSANVDPSPVFQTGPQAPICSASQLHTSPFLKSAFRLVAIIQAPSSPWGPDSLLQGTPPWDPALAPNLSLLPRTALPSRKQPIFTVKVSTAPDSQPLCPRTWQDRVSPAEPFVLTVSLHCDCGSPPPALAEPLMLTGLPPAMLVGFYAKASSLLPNRPVALPKLNWV